MSETCASGGPLGQLVLFWLQCCLGMSPCGKHPPALGKLVAHWLAKGVRDAFSTVDPSHWGCLRCQCSDYVQSIWHTAAHTEKAWNSLLVFILPPQLTANFTARILSILWLRRIWIIRYSWLYGGEKKKVPLVQLVTKVSKTWEWGWYKAPFHSLQCYFIYEADHQGWLFSTRGNSLFHSRPHGQYS